MMENTVLREFEDALREHNIQPPEGGIIADGRIHVCNTIRKNGRGDARYRLYPDAPWQGGFQNWQEQSEWQFWKSSNHGGHKVSAEDRREQEDRKRRREQERVDEQARAEDEARKLWESGTEPGPLYPYLQMKKIPPTGLRQDEEGHLLVPMQDTTGTVRNIQKIYPDGEKRFRKDAPTSGLFFRVGPEGEPDDQIVITEGAANAISLFCSTGRLTYAAMSAGNLLECGLAVRRMHPEGRIVYFADHDKIGMEKAVEAASRTGARVVHSPVEKEDANDVFRLRGAGAVRELIASPVPVEPEPEPPCAGPTPDERPVKDTELAGQEFLSTVLASSVKMKGIEWLWGKRIPMGKFTLFVGDPDLGKSLILTAIASVVSKGGTWPGGEKCREPMDVLIYSLEDDSDDTIVPRLKAAGADLGRIHLLKGVPFQKGQRGMNFQEDIERIDRYLGVHPDIGMVGIDPITAILGKIDSHKYAETRSVMTPVTALFQKHRAALIGINHNTKTPGGKAIMRSQGSVAFIAAARAAFAFGTDPSDTSGETKVMVPSKGNLARRLPGFKYTIESAILPPDPSDPGSGEIDVGRIVWGEQTGITAEEALVVTEPSLKINKAKDLLGSLLSSGPRLETDLQEAGRKMGISRSTLWRAREELKVTSSKEAFSGKWWWELPAKDANKKGGSA